MGAGSAGSVGDGTRVRGWGLDQLGQWVTGPGCGGGGWIRWVSG